MTTTCPPPRTQETRPVKRIIYFDLLSITACVAVVFLHCNTLAHSFQPTQEWAQALVAEVVFFWAVPIFFMLTGANNMGYRDKYDTKTFLIRRMKKLVIPYLFWSAALYIYATIRFSNNTPSISGYVFGLLQNNIEVIYWFFPAIISLTLAMPVLSILRTHRKLMWYLVGMSVFLTFFMPYLCRLIDIPSTASFFLPVAGGYVTYAVLGYLLATQEFNNKRIALVCGIAIVCLVVRYGYTYITSYEMGTTNRVLFEYNSVFALFPAAALFLLYKKIPQQGKLQEYSKPITTISSCCFGVYLIHKPIINILFIELLGFTYESLFVRTICPLLVFGIACAIVYVIKKIPVARALVP